MMTLSDLTVEYNFKLAQLGVPEEKRLSADELLSEVLASIQLDGDDEPPYLGADYDYETLENYLQDFLERWEAAARSDAAIERRDAEERRTASTPCCPDCNSTEIVRINTVLVWSDLKKAWIVEEFMSPNTIQCSPCGYEGPWSYLV